MAENIEDPKPGEEQDASIVKTIHTISVLTTFMAEGLKQATEYLDPSLKKDEKK